VTFISEYLTSNLPFVGFVNDVVSNCSLADFFFFGFSCSVVVVSLVFVVVSLVVVSLALLPVLQKTSVE
jgi:hypothetical protein